MSDLEPKYIHSLTSLRGIAAIWVMLFHIDVLLFYRDFGAFIPHSLTGIISKGYLWVDFFFLLSGFIISHVYGEKLTDKSHFRQNLINYVKARFFRLYPLHIFTLLILISAAIITPLILPNVTKDDSWSTFYAWSAIVDNVLMTHAMNQHVYLSWNIVSWSIAAEWWIYFFAIVIIPLTYRKNSLINITIVTFSSAIIITLFIFKGNKLDITFDYGWIRCLSEFSIGVVVYQIFRKKIGQKLWSNNYYFPLIMILILLHLHFNWNDLIIIPMFCLLILFSVHNKGKINEVLNSRYLRHLGDISYSIYMMHGVWFMLFWFTIPYLKLHYLGPYTPFKKIIFAFIFILFTLISAQYSNKFIERKFRPV
jgi:peptidoglycan/LPS O-acetylase OafA/YrhL